MTGAYWLRLAPVLLGCMAIPIEVAAETAIEQEIVKKTFACVYPERGVQRLALDSYSDTGQRISRREVQVVSDFSRGEGRALLRILQPAELRGVSVLLSRRDDREHELFLYLPAIGAARRVLGANEKESFFGTALTFFDLVPKDPSEFIARWSGNFGPKGCPQLNVVPRIREAGTERMQFCVDPGLGLARELKFFSDGSWTKHVAVAVDSIRKVGGRDVAFNFSVRSNSLGVVTRVSVLDLERLVEIPSRVFSVANLERGSADSDQAMIAPPR